MSGPGIDIGTDGSVSLFYRWRRYRRELGDDSKPQWFKRTSRGFVTVSRSRGRRLERIFQMPGFAKPIRRYPRLESKLIVGQPVYCAVFGLGQIAAFDGENVTVKSGEKEGQVAVQDLVTLFQAQSAWHVHFLRGSKRRTKEGKLLWIIKGLCRFGDWQAFLNRYDIPRSTADDLIRKYNNGLVPEAQSHQLTGNRAIELANPGQPVRERTADPEADEMEELVAQERESRRQKKPSYHPTLWSVRIKLPPDVLQRCRKKYKKHGSKEFWRRAAYRFVGLDPDELDSKNDSQDDESESS